MKLLSVALLASCAFLVACSPTIVHVFEMNGIRVELTNGKCQLEDLNEMAKAGQVELQGGSAKFSTEDKARVLCWRAIDETMVVVQDEKGEGGVIPLAMAKK